MKCSKGIYEILQKFIKKVTKIKTVNGFPSSSYAHSNELVLRLQKVIP